MKPAAQYCSIASIVPAGANYACLPAKLEAMAKLKTYFFLQAEIDTPSPKNGWHLLLETSMRCSEIYKKRKPIETEVHLGSFGIRMVFLHSNIIKCQDKEPQVT